MSDEIKVVKQKLTKNTVYKKEQLKILNRIFEILDIKPDNAKSTISKEKLESKSDEINKLYDKIEICYPSKITSNIRRTKNLAMSIVRSILKYHDYKLMYMTKSCNKNNESVRIQYYCIMSS